MSRFGDDYDGEEFPNQSALWWANIERALKGRRGQRDLRDLEAALLALPEKRLISGHIALNGQVCAVGALAVQRRVGKGEPREEVLAAIESHPPCDHCWHSESEHEDGGCRHCARTVAEAEEAGDWKWTPKLCPGYVPDEEGDPDGGDRTASLGRSVGMTYTLAWRIAYLNDETFGDCTPEERYERVLAWVREQLAPKVPV